MGTRRALVVLLAVGLCIGLQSVPAMANPLEQAVADDGSQPLLLQLQGTEAMVSRPFEGTGVRSAYDLMAQGAIPEVPNIEAERALKPLFAGGSIESIIGTDTRIRVSNTNYYPARRVVYITNTTDGFSCSGWMLGPNMVATAGHCVHSGGSGGKWYTTAGYKVYPGRNGSSAPYGYCTANKLYSVSGWTSSKNEEYDYGAIRLTCTVGNTVGYFGFYWTSASQTGRPAIVPGYPGDKTSTLAATQWWSSDVIRYTTTNQLFYNNDTYGGMSGSPVWEDLIKSPPLAALVRT